jgi:hypothetical protein
VRKERDLHIDPRNVAYATKRIEEASGVGLEPKGEES